MFSTDINQWLQTFDNVAVKWLLNFITLIGFVPFLLVIILIIIAAVNFRYGFLVVNFLGWTVILTILLKEYTNYPRPIEVDETLKDYMFFSGDLISAFRGDSVGTSGFPSGHSSFQTAIWIGLSLLLRKMWLWIFSGVLILLTMISRLYLAHHFLADVLAGLAIGLGVTFFIYWIVKKYKVDKDKKLSIYQQLFFLAPLLLVFFYQVMPVAQVGRFIGINFAFILIINIQISPILDSSIFRRILNAILFLLIYSLFFALGMWISLPDHGLLIIFSYTLLNIIPLFIATIVGEKLGLMHYNRL